MLTGRGTLSGTVLFVAPKAQGMVSSPRSLLRLPFLSHIFSMAGSKQSGEGDESRARGFCAFIAANAETLDSAPALRTLASEKMGDFLRFFVFKTFTRIRRVVAGQQPTVEDSSS
jgi:hypothetical protein